MPQSLVESVLSYDLHMHCTEPVNVVPLAFELRQYAVCSPRGALTCCLKHRARAAALLHLVASPQDTALT